VEESGMLMESSSITRDLFMPQACGRATAPRTRIPLLRGARNGTRRFVSKLRCREAAHRISEHRCQTTVRDPRCCVVDRQHPEAVTRSRRRRGKGGTRIDATRPSSLSSTSSNTMRTTLLILTFYRSPESRGWVSSPCLSGMNNDSAVSTCTASKRVGRRASAGLRRVLSCLFGSLASTRFCCRLPARACAASRVLAYVSSSPAARWCLKSWLNCLLSH
jgi:hypothetical protein